MAISARYAALPPLLSGAAARYWGVRAALRPGQYSSALADFELTVERFDLVERLFALRGLFEWRLAAVASVVLSNGDTVFEGGAHLGTESFYYCTRVGHRGQVVSFEADGGLAERLRLGAAQQGFTQCIVMAEALGPYAREALFEVSGSPAQNSGLGSLAPNDSPGTNRVKVTVTTLDDTYFSRGRPALVVMDIQGGELGALQGGLRVLSEARPVIVLEVESGSLERLGGSADELLALLKEHDYDCWRFTRLGLRAVKAPERDELGDWLALPRERSGGLLRRMRAALVLGGLTPPRSRLSPFAGRRRSRI